MLVFLLFFLQFERNSFLKNRGFYSKDEGIHQYFIFLTFSSLQRDVEDEDDDDHDVGSDRIGTVQPLIDDDGLMVISIRFHFIERDRTQERLLTFDYFRNKYNNQRRCLCLYLTSMWNNFADIRQSGCGFLISSFLIFGQMSKQKMYCIKTLLVGKSNNRFEQFEFYF